MRIEELKDCVRSVSTIVEEIQKNQDLALKARRSKDERAAMYYAGMRDALA